MNMRFSCEDLPLMTDTGSFVINGAERNRQPVSTFPGIYYGIAHDKIGTELHSRTVIPNRGAWLSTRRIPTIFYVRVDEQEKFLQLY